MKLETIQELLTDARDTIDRHLTIDADQHWSHFIIPKGKDPDTYYRETHGKEDAALLTRIDNAIIELESQDD